MLCRTDLVQIQNFVKRFSGIFLTFRVLMLQEAPLGQTARMKKWVKENGVFKTILSKIIKREQRQSVSVNFKGVANIKFGVRNFFFKVIELFGKSTRSVAS